MLEREGWLSGVPGPPERELPGFARALAVIQGAEAAEPIRLDLRG